MYKRAFSLLEISVVVVVSAIIMLVILSAKIMINRANMNSIYNNYATFKQAFLTFRTNEMCLPGECDANYLQKQGFSSSYYAAASSSGIGCASGSGIYAFTGIIDTPVKRTCAFSQIQQRGYIRSNYVSVSPASTAASLAGSNIPYADFSVLAAWDLRYASVANLYPIELSTNLGTSAPSASSAAFVSGWIGAYALILRNAVNVSSPTVANDDIVSPPGGTNNSALSPYLAQMLDLKFDDGKPLTGTVISGFNNGATPPISNGSPSTGCYGLPSGGIFKTITGLEVYGNSKAADLNDGCITAFQVVASPIS